MENREIYHRIYTAKKYPPQFEDYFYPLLNIVVSRVFERVNSSISPNKNIDIFVCLQYLVEEHLYNMNLIEDHYVTKLMSTKEYNDHLILIVTDKIFFNEYLEYHSVNLISKYNPLVSTLTIYLNFIINKYDQLPKINDPAVSLKLDILKKGFLMTKSVLTLLCDGFETEAFSTWRTIHEVECVAKILDDKPYLVDVYLLHIKYNNIYRGGEKDKEKVDAFYNEVKGKLKVWDLKSKDFKKFLEYGWLYSIPNWQVDYPELKLNFRKGLEYVAGLTNYSAIYEASSEIAHGSPLLIYSSKPYYLNLAIMCLYETFIRMEVIFSNIITSFTDVDSTGYFKMKEIYFAELKKNLIKLKLANDMISDEANENNSINEEQKKEI